MDFVVKGIAEGKTKTQREYLEKCNYRIFNKVAKGKKVILFGTGKIAYHFLKKYENKYDIAFFVDNSENKQGKKINDIDVRNPEILKNIEQEKYVVLILSSFYYDEMAEQLDGYGISGYFSYVHLEQNCWDVRMKVATYLFNQKLYSQYGWDFKELKFILMFYLNRVRPIKKNKIVFKSFYGKGYMDHGKYITEQILKENLKYDIVWLVNNMDTEVPEGVRKVDNKDIKQVIYEMATAKVWVNDTLIGSYVRKRKSQIHINTKHWSGVTLKKFYFDSPLFVPHRGVEKRWEYNAKIVDVYVTGSDFDTRTCRQGFRYKNDVLQVGTPRVDILFKQHHLYTEIRKKYGLKEDSKIVLWAPTFRAKLEDGKVKQDLDNCQLNYRQLVKALVKKFGGEWNVMVKLHPSLVTKNIELPEEVINVSAHSDSQELLCAADIVISDYSSIMFDPAYVYKPVFIFAPDYENYLKEERELWFDIRKLPFSYAESNEQLQENVQTFELEKYKKQLESFFAELGVCEQGHASERVVEYIRKIMGSIYA